MARQSMVGACPACEAAMIVTGTECPRCGTRVEGRFDPCKFCALTEEQQAFVELFLVARGNIKEVERELGISYPTVRSRLEQIISDLGHSSDGSRTAEAEAVPADKRRKILDGIETGDLTVDEAVSRLQGEAD